MHDWKQVFPQHDIFCCQKCKLTVVNYPYYPERMQIISGGIIGSDKIPDCNFVMMQKALK